MKSRARAHSNIALAKYWGKADVTNNVPAVPSISMTLDALFTETEVEFSKNFDKDTFCLDGEVREDARVSAMLDRFRERANISLSASVISHNNFPTSAGLASSASGFAALAGALDAALGLSLNDEELAIEARKASASAARSIFGGFAYLPGGSAPESARAASQLFGQAHWDLRLIVCKTSTEKKLIRSTEGMLRAQRTSPLYPHWLLDAPKLAKEIALGLETRYLDRLGQAMEKSTLYFHATAMSATPPIYYWNGVTVTLLSEVNRWREKHGWSIWATADAGPHVKILCEPSVMDYVCEVAMKVPGVLETIVTKPGPGLHARPMEDPSIARR